MQILKFDLVNSFYCFKYSKMQNYKNRLQENFQKLGLGLPVYEADRLDEGWTSSVVLCNGSRFTGKDSPSKVGSEQDAARRALEYYETHKSEFQTDGLLESVLNRNLWMLTDASFIWIIIDLENVGDEKQLQKLENLSKKGFIVSGYASLNYRNVEMVKKYIREPLFRLIQSDQPEAADVSIVMDIERALIEDDFNHIFIISYDKFARAAADVFNMRTEVPTKVHHCRTVDQVLMQLNI